VFKALELGALDFIVKPSRQISPELRSIRDELVGKVRMVTQLKALPILQERARTGGPPTAAQAIVDEDERPTGVLQGAAPRLLVAIGASTGGPPALSQLLAAVDASLPIGVVVTQHMPPKFTRAFAERLQRASKFLVKEAETGDCVMQGTALVAPGAGSLALARDGTMLRVTVEPPDPNLRYVPSVDRMFETASESMAADLLAVVLTGMGGDGGRGVRVVKQRAGRVLAESAETAVIFGMPNEAISTGCVDEVLPLAKMPEAIERFARSRTSSE
jgi:two-component system chemotaxis response regulator CheB